MKQLLAGAACLCAITANAGFINLDFSQGLQGWTPDIGKWEMYMYERVWSEGDWEWQDVGGAIYPYHYSTIPWARDMSLPWVSNGQVRMYTYQWWTSPEDNQFVGPDGNLWEGDFGVYSVMLSQTAWLEAGTRLIGEGKGSIRNRW